MKLDLTFKDILQASLIPIGVVLLFAMQAYGDQRWVMRAETFEAKIFEYQEKIFLLRKGGLTQEEKELIEFYEHQIQQLQAKKG